ncbi:hypothetical protein [Calderihabitans maritimus]|uniref:Uncharacterized protein n=1 Tax=Calderihabitans maritimus TaxID=1246530 RepID=A0A1Z5HNT2_9FIRM|nr:hypothetical protein [Calderihabitans maritimus]GAW91192.1 hypothetical protein KKC1_03540 [Calderihabitans maritimus]
MKRPECGTESDGKFCSEFSKQLATLEETGVAVTEETLSLNKETDVFVEQKKEKSWQLLLVSLVALIAIAISVISLMNLSKISKQNENLKDQIFLNAD